MDCIDLFQIEEKRSDLGRMRGVSSALSSPVPGVADTTWVPGAARYPVGRTLIATKIPSPHHRNPTTDHPMLSESC